MYFSGAETEELCTKLDAEPSRGMSTDSLAARPGIAGPRRGYSRNKVVEMLHSEHIRGLSKQMRQASALMALDAKARQEATDTYQGEQRKLFEAQWARKAEENLQIQAEVQTVKARYMERVRRVLAGVARETATFENWPPMKQSNRKQGKWRKPWSFV
jgi:hypothetical protein